ncbi:MAG: class I adenylate-forming enzyme family protein [Thermoplasmataceae archaeon]
MIEKRLLTETKEVLFFYGREYLSTEVVARYRSVATYLIKRGIKPGDVVAVDLLNRPELLFIIFGSWLAGATVSPINVHLKSDEISYQLADSGARIIFAENSYRENIMAAISKSGHEVMDVILDFDNPKNSSEYRDVFCGDGNEIPTARNPEDLFIIYTSGTTGKPKGAVLMSGNVYSEALQLQHVVNIQDSDRMIIVLPLFHVNNLMFSMSVILKGGSVIILRKFDVKEFLDQVKEYEPTMFSGVPTVYKMLTDSFSAENRDMLKSLNVGICGAAPMPVKWFQDFENTYGIKIVEGYGMTEGTVASTLNPRYGTRKIGSIGIPFPGQDVRIFSDADEELPPGEIGEIAVRGPNVMKGYLNREGDSAETLRNGWLHTGDLGYMDADGYFYIVDRKKDMIIRGGENVYPKEVENVISNIPNISEAAVVGKTDSVYGEEVAAFVVRKNQRLKENDIIEYCRKNMAWFKCPKEVIFLDELPKNSVGKVQKSELRKIIRERHIQ